MFTNSGGMDFRHVDQPNINMNTSIRVKWSAHRRWNISLAAVKTQHSSQTVTARPTERRP